MRVGAFPAKAPGDRLDYSFDFTDDLLADETLAGAPAVAADIVGLSIESPAATASQVIVWIEAGDAQTLYTLACVATTSQGRTRAAGATLYVGTIGLDDPALAPLGP